MAPSEVVLFCPPGPARRGGEAHEVTSYFATGGGTTSCSFGFVMHPAELLILIDIRQITSRLLRLPQALQAAFHVSALGIGFRQHVRTTSAFLGTGDLRLTAALES